MFSTFVYLNSIYETNGPRLTQQCCGEATLKPRTGVDVGQEGEWTGGRVGHVRPDPCEGRKRLKRSSLLPVNLMNFKGSTLAMERR